MRQHAHREAGAALEVSDWPGGVEPVWSLPEPESVRALRAEPVAGDGAVHLTEPELAQSEFVVNALVLLEEMGGWDTLWMGRLKE